MGAADEGEEGVAATAPPPPSYGERWAAAFGMHDPEIRAALRTRYATLRERLVFRMDAADIADPLTALAAMAEDTVDKEDDDDEGAHGSDGGDGSRPGGSDRPHTGSKVPEPTNASWSQFFNDDNLLQEINTDLDRLYPAGNEGFFQNPTYLGILREILFVWCKLHPDVSYRQGMHDVAAVVFYAFLPERTQRPAVPSNDGDYDGNLFGPQSSAPSMGNLEKHETDIELPQHIEADSFLVFEAIMVFLKPFYEIVKTKHQEARERMKENDQERLFSSFTWKENDDPNRLFGGAGGEAMACASPKRRKPALHRLCHHIQYDLLEQKDPQLYYHLQNLEIVPETYCLRWIRLLFAREYTFEALLILWDAMIRDRSRSSLIHPPVTSADEWMKQLPRRMDESAEDDWMGFPLLRFLCIAKLLSLSRQLRQADNTGCLRLLMQSFNADDDEDPSAYEASALQLVRFAQVLQDPMLEQQDGAVDVVKFGGGALGIVLTAAKPPYEDRLAVKDFAPDPTTVSRQGQAQLSGRVRVGDLLESINGVPITGITTEEVKRHIQLIARPLYIGFRHCTVVEEPTTGDHVPLSLLSPQSSKAPTGEFQAPDVVLPHFLPGEMCFANVETSIQTVSLAYDGSCAAQFVKGKFFITNYRCIFTRTLGRGEIEWQVPVLSIATIDGSDVSLPMPPSATTMDHAQAVLGFTSDDSYNVVIRCKDTQVTRLSFSNFSDYQKLMKCLGCLAFPSSLLDAFCFAYSPTIAPSEEVPFDLRREYQRIGLLAFPDRLRCIDQSPRYELCETYPQHLIVPAEMTDLKVKTAAAFRSNNRLPVVTWMHPQNGATIVRSSQPLVGLKSNRSSEDELLVRLLCCSGNLHSFGRHVIMDARSQLAAVGNKAMGKGTEIVANYRGAKLVFMNIDNIHAVRQSQQSLASIFEPKKGISEDSGSSFYGRIESSGWLRHVRLVLKASVELAQSVHGGVSVLTHCSDGWDRTAQMVALAELMLDPYYRTLRGFECLIEKEWCSFGHQFAARCGHARGDASNDQRSPVFLLWLDCVWQFIRQFPTECEFNESLLLALADHVYSCKYGTFMFDCERQRKEFFAKHRVCSIWSDVNSHSERYLNPLFAPSTELPIVAPSTLSKNIKLWKGYFCRWDPTMVPSTRTVPFYY